MSDKVFKKSDTEIKEEALRDYIFNNKEAKIRIAIKQANEKVRGLTFREKLKYPH